QKGKLIIESKSLVEKMRCFISKNSFVKLIFKDKILRIKQSSKKIELISPLMDRFYSNELEEVPIEGLEKLNYNSHISLSKCQINDIISKQEKFSNIFKITPNNNSFSFPKQDPPGSFLGFSLIDIKRIIIFLFEEYNRINFYIKEGFPLKIEIKLRSLGNSKLFFYLSPHKREFK
ncbi:unnamed protein product, partial [marine sediment metagenome]